MTKYVNEMEDYLYNHNYISENNNNIKQQELSIERASCIVQKYRTLTEEKDKEIEGLNKDLQTAIDICNNRQKEIVRLNNIIKRIGSLVDRTITVIEQQPTGNDEWILERLNGIKYLTELKEGENDE